MKRTFRGLYTLVLAIVLWIESYLFLGWLWPVGVLVGAGALMITLMELWSLGRGLEEFDLRDL